MKKLKDLYKRFKMPFWTIIGTLGVFLIWYLISLIANTTLLPGPNLVLPQFCIYLTKLETYQAIGLTLLRLLISSLFSGVFGLILGIFAGLFPSFRAFLKPFITVFKTIPTAAVIFVIIALVKPAFGPIIIVFLITFPIMYESVVSGFLSVDQTLIDAAKVDGANKFKTVFKIYLPLSTNYIVLGLVSSIGLGMKVSIMSEILAGSSSSLGLGKLIRDAQLIVDMQSILAYSLMAIIIIGIIDIAIYFAKRKLKATIKIKQKKEDEN